MVESKFHVAESQNIVLIYLRMTHKGAICTASHSLSCDLLLTQKPRSDFDLCGFALSVFDLITPYTQSLWLRCMIYINPLALLIPCKISREKRITTRMGHLPYVRASLFIGFCTQVRWKLIEALKLVSVRRKTSTNLITCSSIYRTFGNNTE